LTLDKVTINDNFASFGGGVASQTFYTTSIINSTISGNTADHSGGGLFSSSNCGTAVCGSTLHNSTVVFNSAVVNGGGIFTDFGAVELEHTLVAMNTAGLNLGQDCGGGLTTS